MSGAARDGAAAIPGYDEQAPALRAEVVELLAATTSPVAQPTAVFTGGQPGAGKSRSIVGPLVEQYADRGSIAVIDPDALRPLFAQAQHEMRTTGMFSNAAYQAAGVLGYEVSLALAAQSRNLLRDGTLALAKYPTAEIDTLHRRGYRVEVHVAAVYEDLSRARTILRREHEITFSQIGFGRDVPRAFHDQAVAGVARTTGVLWQNPHVGRLVLYEREGQIVFDRQRNARGAWTDAEGREHTGPGPDAIVAHLQHEPTPADLAKAAATWLDARTLLQAPTRPVAATEAAIASIERELGRALQQVARTPEARTLAAREPALAMALADHLEQPLAAPARAWLRDPQHAPRHWPEHHDLMAYAEQAVPPVLKARQTQVPATTEHEVRQAIAGALSRQTLVTPERLQQWTQARSAPRTATPVAVLEHDRAR